MGNIFSRAHLEDDQANIYILPHKVKTKANKLSIRMKEVEKEGFDSE